MRLVVTPTSVLMQEFYKQMLQENKTPSEALRAAQRNLWSNPEWRNPYYWAAFTKARRVEITAASQERC
ncbi:MAG: CHAT domain-containing protein [Cyanobacteria bacterium P01_A01_bin.80]